MKRKKEKAEYDIDRSKSDDLMDEIGEAFDKAHLLRPEDGIHSAYPSESILGFDSRPDPKNPDRPWSSIPVWIHPDGNIIDLTGIEIFSNDFAVRRGEQFNARIRKYHSAEEAAYFEISEPQIFWASRRAIEQIRDDGGIASRPQIESIIDFYLGKAFCERFEENIAPEAIEKAARRDEMIETIIIAIQPITDNKSRAAAYTARILMIEWMFCRTFEELTGCSFHLDIKVIFEAFSEARQIIQQAI